MDEPRDLVIVGGGIAGLTAAATAEAAGRSVLVLDGRPGANRASTDEVGGLPVQPRRPRPVPHRGRSGRPRPARRPGHRRAGAHGRARPPRRPRRRPAGRSGVAGPHDPAVAAREAAARPAAGRHGPLELGYTFEPTEFNGAVGVLARKDGEPGYVTALTVADGRVCRIYTVSNPDKLAALRLTGPVT